MESAIDNKLVDLIHRINELVSSDTFDTVDDKSFHEACYSSLLPQESDREDSFEILDVEDSKPFASTPPLASTDLYPDLSKF